MLSRDWTRRSLERVGALPGRRIDVIDMHTAGEPLRIVVAAPALPEGPDMLARRRDAMANWEEWRRALMLEPRGHPDMYGAVIVPPVSPGALFGVLFLHNEGYSTMCGHAIIALARAAVELEWTQVVEPITTMLIDTPAGPVTAQARVEAGRVLSTAFENVPSFAAGLDRRVEVPDLGEVAFDLAFGGAYYAFVEAEPLGLSLSLGNARRILDMGMAIKDAVAERFPISHPGAADLGFLYGTIFTGPPLNKDNHSRHACVFANGALDRSPHGTGVSARLALLHARGVAAAGSRHVIESLTGQSFSVCFEKAVVAADRVEIVPIVEGTAFFTGHAQYVLEPDDPLAEGFLIR